MTKEQFENILILLIKEIENNLVEELNIIKNYGEMEEILHVKEEFFKLLNSINSSFVALNKEEDFDYGKSLKEIIIDFRKVLTVIKENLISILPLNDEVILAYTTKENNMWHSKVCFLGDIIELKDAVFDLADDMVDRYFDSIPDEIYAFMCDAPARLLN